MGLVEIDSGVGGGAGGEVGRVVGGISGVPEVEQVEV